MADAMNKNQEPPTDVVGGRPTQPKVFISYSWTAKDKARNLAERLLVDGVDVVMDIYDLKEGMEKYADPIAVPLRSKKSLARIPLCRTGAEFAAFVRAGRRLGDLHCGYEKAAPWPGCVIDVMPDASQDLVNPDNLVRNALYAVTKMRFAKKTSPVDENRNGKLDRWELEDRSRILYNDRITIRGIPLAAYDYVVNGKSAIEWVMERYQVTTNKDSGIVNDPNLWLKESGNERYIVDLLLKVITVSMETQKIVTKLPKLEFGE